MRDPDKGSPAIAAGRNSEATFNATNQPSNSDVLPSDPSKGFQDPNNQYPKKESINKTVTNTLAVGINSPSINADPRSPAGDRKSTSPGASPAARNASRKREVKTAGRNGTTWSQPESPYAAQYPYNKVFGGERMYDETKNTEDTSNNFYKVGDRIAQIIIIPYPQIEFEEVEELSNTERGEGGFGSTGN